MKAPLEVIADLGIPTDNYIAAAMSVNDLSFEKSLFESYIAEIIGMPQAPVFENDKATRIYFGYTVQETVRAFSTGNVPDMEDVWDTVVARASNFIEENTWSVKEYRDELNEDGTAKLDAAGNPKQRKGAKKEQAIKVWNDNADKQDTLSRKEWIALLCEEVGLSTAGASTYYANLKKGKL